MSHPALIYIAPTKARYGLAADKYAALVAALEQNKDAKNAKVDGNSGSVSYSGVDFAWTYFPNPPATLASGPFLEVDIVHKHGLKANIAGNDTIFELLNEELISKL
jgi:hypothetical protein